MERFSLRVYHISYNLLLSWCSVNTTAVCIQLDRSSFARSLFVRSFARTCRATTAATAVAAALCTFEIYHFTDQNIELGRKTTDKRTCIHNSSPCMRGPVRPAGRPCYETSLDPCLNSWSRCPHPLTPPFSHDAWEVTLQI